MFTTCSRHVHNMFPKRHVHDMFMPYSRHVQYSRHVHCSQHVHDMFMTCSMFTTSSLFTTCSWHVQVMFTACSHVHDMFPKCSRHFYDMFTICSWHVLDMFTTCSGHVHDMFTTCSGHGLFDAHPKNCLRVMCCYYVYGASIQPNINTEKRGMATFCRIYTIQGSTLVFLHCNKQPPPLTLSICKEAGELWWASAKWRRPFIMGAAILEYNEWNVFFG